MEKIFDILTNYGISLGFTEQVSRLVVGAIFFSFIVFLFILIDWSVKKICEHFLVRLSKKTKTTLDDLLLVKGIPRRIAHLIPLAVFYLLLPNLFQSSYYVQIILVKVLEIACLLGVGWLLHGLFKVFKAYLFQYPSLKVKPLDSYFQILNLLLFLISLLFTFVIITNTSVWKFFTVLGAASAVLLFIFKDLILGVVASIQISFNDIVRVGDWITFKKYSADGDVLEMNLTTVKVQNFDKTITTIPTYAMIADSFQNWRGMEQSDGRRIKRYFYIRQNSIRFLEENDLKKLSNIALIKDYLQERQQEILEYNKLKCVDEEDLINGRNLTNIGVFCRYIKSYLSSHSKINQEMTLMVRQLNPTSEGLPVEIYAFCSDKTWVNYEQIMSDLFDHVLAIVPFFDLEIFELEVISPKK